MKLLRLAFLLMVLLSSTGALRAQTFAWAKVALGANDSTFAQTGPSATDAAGNTYVAFDFKDSLRVGSIRLTGPRQQSSAVVRFDSAGRAVWAQLLVNVQVYRLAADNSAGGVFVAAYNKGSATWAGAPVPTTATAPFYGKCSAAGVLLWSSTLPLPASNGLYDLVADNSGNAYLHGTVRTASPLAGTTVDAASTYLLKFNSAGTSQWVHTLHTTFSFATNYVLGPKPGGGVLVGGLVSRSPLYLDAGTTTVVATPSNSANGDGFLCSFDAAGNLQWSQLLTNTRGGSLSFETPQVRALAADAAGNCYVTGGTIQSAGAWSTMILGGVTLGSGYFLAKFDAAGTRQWVRGAAGPLPTPPLPNIYDAGTLLAATGSGVTVAVNTTVLNGTSGRELTLGTLTLRAPFNFVHYTAQGDELWAAADTWRFPASTQPAQPYFQPVGLGSDARGNLYPVGYSAPRSAGTAALPAPTIQLGAQLAVGKGAIVARLNAYANTLRGQVYFDLNANGTQDSGEGLFPRPLSSVLTQGAASSYVPVNIDGGVQAYATAGAYSLTLAPIPASYTITQPSSGSYTGTFGGANQLVSGQNFGIAPVANQADVRVTLTPYGAARAGFTVRYRVTVENVGTTTASGSVSTTLDSHLSYVSSTPSGSNAGQTTSWTYTNLVPFGMLQYDVLASLPTNTTLGTALTSLAAAPLTGDVDATNNTASAAQTVVGPYDPNSIEVNYERLSPAQVATRQPLDYTIHFQNLGTAEATSVVLTDTLDASKLNLNSVVLVSQSHNCTWWLSSTSRGMGLLTVRFLGINLPARNADVIRSQGFVRFRVQPRSTLAVGDVVPNNADIFFDYNAPVRTNTATTTVTLTSAALANHTAAAWNAYPNPATDAVTVAADLATAGPVRLDLLDALGRTVRQQVFTAPAGPLRQTLDLRDLAPGFYVLRLTPSTGPASSQQLVRE